MADKTELELLKERADMMGITYHPSIGIDKLKSKLAEKQPAKAILAKESLHQRNARLRKEANRLVRIRLTNMNPDKAKHPGEILSVSNSAIGSIKKFIPYNAENGWHVPKALLGILQTRTYQSHYTVQREGKKVKRVKQVPEFAIAILPDMTPEELKDLADKQALTGISER